MSRRSKLYPTPDEAERAFYDAFERADLAAMMAVWAESDTVVCVHPNGPRLVGFEAVRDSWMQIFAGGGRLRVEPTDVKRIDGPGLAVRTLIERVTVAGRQDPVQPVFATNVYELTDGGWRMVTHHASGPSDAPAPEPAPSTPHTLH